jgi:hypothetical protein
MKTKFLLGLAAGVVFSLVEPQMVQAVSLSLVSSSSDIEVGGFVSIDLRIADLGNLTAPSLSAFNIALEFDPNRLALRGVTFGDPQLGDLIDVSGLAAQFDAVGFRQPTPGAVRLFESSFDSPAQLDSQPASFGLATLSFEALAPGSSSLEFSTYQLADAIGDPLAVDFARGSSFVIRETPNATVPEPVLGGFGASLIAGIGILCCKRRVRERSRGAF